MLIIHYPFRNTADMFTYFVQKYKMTFNMVCILYAWGEPKASYKMTNNVVTTVCFIDITENIILLYYPHNPTLTCYIQTP